MEEYTLDSRLLTLLSQPCRMDEIRRALPTQASTKSRKHSTV